MQWQPGIFEGAHASLNPYASVLAGAGSLAAGPNGVILGRFGWINTDTGQVTSSILSCLGTEMPNNILGTEGGGVIGLDANYPVHPQLCFVLPVWGTWNKEYWGGYPGSPPQLILREGLPVTCALVGDFWARFQGGAYIGDPVYASPYDGSAWSSDPGGYAATGWLVLSNANPGELAIIGCQNLN